MTLLKALHPRDDVNRLYVSFHSQREQILLAYGIPKESVAAITILYRNTKVKVSSPDGDTEYLQEYYKGTR